jgi:hypothetical protein
MPDTNPPALARGPLCQRGVRGDFTASAKVYECHMV